VVFGAQPVRRKAQPPSPPSAPAHSHIAKIFLPRLAIHFSDSQDGLRSYQVVPTAFSRHPAGRPPVSLALPSYTSKPFAPKPVSCHWYFFRIQPPQSRPIPDVFPPLPGNSQHHSEGLLYCTVETPGIVKPRDSEITAFIALSFQ
jgi:hypothetical protein